MSDPSQERSVAPTTTTQQDLTTAGQRRVNLIWEYTQAAIAIVVVLANIIVAVFNAVTLTNNEHPDILTSSLFLVIGFYFSRTNHAQIGGIGEKPMQEYKGR